MARIVKVVTTSLATLEDSGSRRSPRSTSSRSRAPTGLEVAEVIAEHGPVELDAYLARCARAQEEAR